MHRFFSDLETDRGFRPDTFCLTVEENPVFFSGFLFPDDNVFFYTAVFVDGIMGQVKNVADAQGGVQVEDYDGIIAYVLLGTLVIVLKVL